MLITMPLRHWDLLTLSHLVWWGKIDWEQIKSTCLHFSIQACTELCAREAVCQDFKGTQKYTYFCKKRLWIFSKGLLMISQLLQRSNCINDGYARNNSIYKSEKKRLMILEMYAGAASLLSKFSLRQMGSHRYFASDKINSFNFRSVSLPS